MSFKEEHMKKTFCLLVVNTILFVSCSTRTAVSKRPRSGLPDLPRTSPETRPHGIEEVLYVHDVGKAEVDMLTNELILTTFRRGAGGMRIRLFEDYARVPVQDYIYDAVKVPLEDFKIYVITITAEDKVGMVTFQIKDGKIFIR